MGNFLRVSHILQLISRGFSLAIAKYEKRGKHLPILHKSTCDYYFIVKCLLKSNVWRVIFLINCIELAPYNLMLTWYKKAKTVNANFTLLYLVFPNSFAFPYFNSSILCSVRLFGIWWSFGIDLGIFEFFVPNIRLLLKTCTTYYVDGFTVLIYFTFNLDSVKIIK